MSIEKTGAFQRRIQNRFHPSTILVKSFILDVSQISEYDPAMTRINL